MDIKRGREPTEPHEIKVLDILKEITMPEGYTAHYSYTNQNIQKRSGEIDIVLVGPQGLFTLEIKGGNVNKDKGTWTQNGRVIPNPFNQAIEWMYEIKKLVEKRYPAIAKKMLFGSGVIMPDVTFSSENVPAETVLDYEFINSPEGKLIEFILYNPGHHKVEDLNAQEVEFINKLLLADSRSNIVSSLRKNIDDNERKIIKWSDEQVQFFKELNQNPRIVVKGPPGSGKTILAKAELIDNESKAKKTLYICKTIANADSLRASIKEKIGHEPKHVEISHIDASAKKYSFENNTYNMSYYDMAKNAAKIISQKKDFKKFDMLIIDEAQELMIQEYVELMESLLNKGIDNGNWLLLMDTAQDIFNEYNDEIFKAYFKKVSFFVQLSKNYRNTIEIQVTASLLANYSESEPGENINGPVPKFIEYSATGDDNGRGEEAVRVKQYIEGLFDEGIKPKEITILSYKGKDESIAGRRMLNFKNRAKLIHVKDVNWDNIEDNQLIYASVFQYKGLENEVIIFTDVTDIDMKPMSRARHLVGATRAREIYAVFLSTGAMNYLRNHPKYGNIIDQINKSKDVPIERYLELIKKILID
jgi:nucleoside-triphosphatase THEP1